MPITKSACLNGVEEEDLLFCSPSFLENGLEERFEKDKRVCAKVCLRLCANGKAFKTLVESWASGALDVDLVGYVAVTSRTGTNARSLMARLVVLALLFGAFVRRHWT